jgi:hypothetical protein
MRKLPEGVTEYIIAFTANSTQGNDTANANDTVIQVYFTRIPVKNQKQKGWAPSLSLHYVAGWILLCQIQSGFSHVKYRVDPLM